MNSVGEYKVLPIRILILGIFNDKKPRHGYEIRQTLESWAAEKWANIGYGSIYSALKKMAEEGLLKIVEAEEDDGKADKIIYQITQQGSEAFANALSQQWMQLQSTIDPFQVAVVFMNYMQKNDLISALEYRADILRLVIKSSDKVVPIQMKNLKMPKHMLESFALVLAHYQTELTWIEGIIEKVKRDELP